MDKLTLDAIDESVVTHMYVMLHVSKTSVA